MTDLNLQTRAPRHPSNSSLSRAKNDIDRLQDRWRRSRTAPSVSQASTLNDQLWKRSTFASAPVADIFDLIRAPIENKRRQIRAAKGAEEPNRADSCPMIISAI